MSFKIYLTGQNNFGNRGCEALVRSTVDVVRGQWPDAQVWVPSYDQPRDAAQWPEAASLGVRFVAVPPVSRRFVHWNRAASRLGWVARLPWPALPADDPIRRDLQACDAVLSIGGDNYSLDYDLGSLAYFKAVADAALGMGKPVLLWGASVGPFSRLPAVEQAMAAHLRSLSAVLVRESASLNYLQGLGVQANLAQVADSAFLLRRQALDSGAYWPQGEQGVLGLNLSPLVDAVRRRAGVQGNLLDEAATFVRQLLARTGMGVLLVPHVAPLDGRSDNNDEHYLAQLLARLADLEPRVRMAPGGLNAAQLKQLISQCRFFVGARTHATIAAMSTGVPTVSIAYSVKAVGINRDLFGHERYVLDTRKVDANALAAAVAQLEADEAVLRQQYEQRLPQWRERAGLGGAWLKRSLTGASANP